MPPVKWLMHWHPSPGATVNSQILSEACGCAESLGGSKDGRWKTSIFFYRAMTRDGAGGPAGQQHPDLPRELLGVALHERPGLYFSIVRAQRLVLQADAAFPQVMEKLQSYRIRVALNFEGFQYQLGDFCLRIGKCVPNNSETLRGIMMEVEYYPLSSIEKSKAVMEDFFDIWQETVAKKSLPGQFIHVDSSFSDYGLSDQYSFQHTAVQYATCLQQLIAAVTAEPPAFVKALFCARNGAHISQSDKVTALRYIQITSCFGLHRICKNFKDRKSGAWGFVVRDHEGSVILAGAGNLDNVHDVLCVSACMLDTLIAITRQLIKE